MLDAKPLNRVIRGNNDGGSAFPDWAALQTCQRSTDPRCVHNLFERSGLLALRIRVH